MSDTHKYIRLNPEGSDDPNALETGLVTFVSDSDPDLRVDLIGCIHLGEQSYFDELNARFKVYDSLLFELVTEPADLQKQSKPKKKTNKKSPFSFIRDMQHRSAGDLGLVHQVDVVDYTPANFVHADMTPDQLAQAFGTEIQRFMQSVLQDISKAWQQGTLGQYFSNVLQQLLSSSMGNTQVPNFGKSGQQDRKQLRREFAKMLTSVDLSNPVLLPMLHTILIEKRNEVALDVLRQEIAAGKKKIGIFYGAGHCPDFERSLKDEFGLVPVDEEWIQAWDLS